MKILVLALALAATFVPALSTVAEAGTHNGKSCSNRTSQDMKQGYSC